MAFKLGIKGKTLEQCSFNERLMLATVDVHGANVRNGLESIVTAGDAVMSAMRSNQPVSDSAKVILSDMRTETEARINDEVCKSVLRFAAHYFPEYAIEIEYIPDGDAPPKNES